MPVNFIGVYRQLIKVCAQNGTTNGIWKSRKRSNYVTSLLEYFLGNVMRSLWERSPRDAAGAFNQRKVVQSRADQRDARNRPFLPHTQLRDAYLLRLMACRIYGIDLSPNYEKQKAVCPTLFASNMYSLVLLIED